MRIATRVVPAATLAGLFFAATALAADGPDDLWEITMKMEMAGMPAMAPQINKTCKRRGDRNPDTNSPDSRSDCRATDVNTTGAKTTWKMVCTKPDPMTGTGEMTYEGDRYNGTLKLSGTMEGEPFNMTQVISGKKVGNCTYEEPHKRVEKMQAQNRAVIAKECDKEIENLSPQLIFGDPSLPPEVLLCKDRKADFCARATKLTQQMRDPAAFEEVNGKYPKWRDAIKACGTDPTVVSGPACKTATDKKNFVFVAEHCPAEAKALAKKHCVGLDYTSAMSSEYRDICRSFGADVAKENVATPKPAAASTSTTDSAKEQKQPTAGDTVKEGAKKLKKLLKF